MGDDVHQRTLYVGNLDPSVTEELLITLFGKLGTCLGCKIIREAGNDLYAFVEFANHLSAQMALMTMNKRQFLNREMKVNWATSPGSHSKQDTSNHFHVFVGDLSPDISTNQLKEAFSPFGEISDCKVIKDTQTLVSKGFGFVSFVRKEDAECAIAGMNGQWLGNKPIRTNWATRKPAATNERQTTQKQLRYEDVYSQSSETNSTVYCGGIMSGLTDEIVKEAFSRYGPVQEVRVFKEKGYAFIRFDSKKAATEAIVGMHGSDVGGYSVKCSWGKETTEGSQGSQGQASGGSTSSSSQLYQSPPYQQQPPAAPYYNPMGYYNYPGPGSYGGMGQPYGQQQPPPQQPFGGYGYGYNYGNAAWGPMPPNQQQFNN